MFKVFVLVDKTMHSVTLSSLYSKMSHIVVKISHVCRIWEQTGEWYDEVLTLLYQPVWSVRSAFSSQNTLKKLIFDGFGCFIA